MERTLDVATGESVAFRYELAGLGSRFYAVFAGLVGKTPRAFRAAMRPGQGGP